ncbi:MAG: hypothetical protein IPK82_41975 [Polyangiaceae bacterium]|nr:hypothetical protein [Polyangiaceae bacterium]
MCRRITCPQCGKPSFSGCGAHVEQVLRDVPVNERCRCAEEHSRQTSGQADAAVKKSGWFDGGTGL